MTHHTDAELLPCPFCGDHAETDFIPEHHSYAIECHSMGCAARVIKDTASDAIEAWNRRAPAAPVPQGWKLVPEKGTEAMARAFRADDAPGYFCMTTLRCADFSERYAAMLAAAPQPPEAAPVPQFSRIAQKKLDYLLEAGEAITGYAIENKDGRRGAIDCHGFVYWWQDAAAPQLLANHGIQERST